VDRGKRGGNTFLEGIVLKCLEKVTPHGLVVSTQQATEKKGKKRQDTPKRRVEENGRCTQSEKLVAKKKNNLSSSGSGKYHGGTCAGKEQATGARRLRRKSAESNIQRNRCHVPV